ncbi:MAG: glycerophosphoryl diester phosphodiesterase [Planctomycetota bacterium]
MTTPSHPAIARIRNDLRARPLVVSHRGDSFHHPENTLASFQAATDLGVAIQEFDVRELSCGELVCVHDASFDRTSNAKDVLGAGALVADMDWATASQLDVGSWHAHGKASERVPTLAQALAVMLPTCLPLIEHKAGSASRYVDFLRRSQRTDQVILQSFDWHFLQNVHDLAPEIAIGALGPSQAFPSPSDDAIASIQAFGAELIHWRARELTANHVDRIHAAGLLACTYTTDEERGWLHGRTLGFDAMCTNKPQAMMDALWRD